MKKRPNEQNLPMSALKQMLSFVGSRVVEAISLHPKEESLDEDSWESELPVFSLKEVSLHDTPSDCWTVIYDRVYDISNFLAQHPGGEEVMLEYAGRDSTLAYRSVGHSRLAETTLKSFLIGILPKEERLWRGGDTLREITHGL